MGDEIFWYYLARDLCLVIAGGLFGGWLEKMYLAPRRAEVPRDKQGDGGGAEPLPMLREE